MQVLITATLEQILAARILDAITRAARIDHLTDPDGQTHELDRLFRLNPWLSRLDHTWKRRLLDAARATRTNTRRATNTTTGFPTWLTGEGLNTVAAAALAAATGHHEHPLPTTDPPPGKAPPPREGGPPRDGGPPREGGPPGAAGTGTVPGAQNHLATPGHPWCAQTGTLNLTTLATLACDATLTTITTDPTGAILHLGRGHRTATWHQRKALTARDRGCVIPACTQPPAICHAHHLNPWADGGPTDLDNLALICPRHHRDTHAGTWTLLMINNIPHAIPPPWITPNPAPLRNTTHHATTSTTRTAQQLLLDLDPPQP